jgi:hypothetical protein
VLCEAGHRFVSDEKPESSIGHRPGGSGSHRPQLNAHRFRCALTMDIDCEKAGECSTNQFTEGPLHAKSAINPAHKRNS